MSTGIFRLNVRINGKTYYARLGLGLLTVIILFTVGLTPRREDGFGTPATVLLSLTILSWWAFQFIQIKQRANDVGKHPLLLAIVAWITPLYFILGFIPGEKQANKYGPVPSNKVKLT